MSGGQVIGVVLNNVDVRSDSQYQYYTSYYTYYSPTNTEPKVKSRVPEVDVDANFDKVPEPPAQEAQVDYSDEQY